MANDKFGRGCGGDSPNPTNTICVTKDEYDVLVEGQALIVSCDEGNIILKGQDGGAYLDCPAVLECINTDGTISGAGTADDPFTVSVPDTDDQTTAEVTHDNSNPVGPLAGLPASTTQADVNAAFDECLRDIKDGSLFAFEALPNGDITWTVNGNPITISPSHPVYTIGEDANGDTILLRDGVQVGVPVPDADTVSPALTFAPNATIGTDVFIGGVLAYTIPDNEGPITMVANADGTTSFFQNGVLVGTTTVVAPDTNTTLVAGTQTVNADGSIEQCFTTTSLIDGSTPNGPDDQCFTLPPSGGSTSEVVAGAGTDSNGNDYLAGDTLVTLDDGTTVAVRVPCDTGSFSGECVKLSADTTLDASHAGKVVEVDSDGVIITVPNSFSDDPATPCSEDLMPLMISNTSNGDIAVIQGGNYISVSNSDNVVRDDGVYWAAGVSCPPQYVGPRVQGAMDYNVNPGTTSPFEYDTLRDALDDIDTRQTSNEKQTVQFLAPTDITGEYLEVRGDHVEIDGSGVVLTGDAVFNRADVDIRSWDLEGTLLFTENSHGRFFGDIQLGTVAGDPIILGVTEQSSLVGGANSAQIVWRAGAVSTSTTGGAHFISGMSHFSGNVITAGALTTAKISQVARQSFSQYGPGSDINTATASQAFAFDVSDNSQFIPGTGNYQADAGTAIFGAEYGGSVKFSESTGNRTDIDGVTPGQVAAFARWGGDIYMRNANAVFVGANIATLSIPALTPDDAEVI